MPKPNNNPFFWTKLELNTFLKTHKLPSKGTTLQKRRLAHSYLKNKTNKMSLADGVNNLFGRKGSKENLLETDNLGAVGGHPPTTSKKDTKIDDALATIIGRLANLEARERQTYQPHPAFRDNPSIVSIMSQVPSFSGLHTENVREFFEKLDRIGTLGHWTDQEKLQVLGLKVEAQARTFWETLLGNTPTITYKSAKEKIIKRFEQDKSPGDLLRQFSTMKLKDGETIDSLADRVTAIQTRILTTNGQDVIQTLTKVLEQMAIDSFIHALPTKMGRQVKVMFPETIDAARRIAQTIQQLDLADKTETIFYAKTDTESDTDSTDSTQTKSSSPKLKQRSTNHRKVRTASKKFTTKPPYPCYYCKGNHWHSDCPDKRKSSPASSRSSSRSNSPTPSTSRVRCYTCDGIGHMSWECPSRRSTSRDKERRRGTKHRDDDETCLICKKRHQTAKCDKLAKIIKEQTKN